jgi:hypothetical protein
MPYETDYSNTARTLDQTIEQKYPPTHIDVPRVSVIMSVYNGETHIRAAIDSILAQTFRDFEFIIIDDCSSDQTWNILTDYASRDSRLVLLRNDTNTGLTKSLNRGIHHARGEYIARQDADDLSLPTRFMLQVQHLDASPNVGVVGTWCWIIDDQGTDCGVSRLPTSPDAIKWKLLFGNHLVHTSIMMRAEIVRAIGGYTPARTYSQDYDLWLRMRECTNLVNLPMPLVKKRRSTKNISSQYMDGQDQTAIHAMQQAMNNLLHQEVDIESVTYLRRTIRGRALHNTQAVRQVVRLVLLLYFARTNRNDMNPAETAIIKKETASILYILAGHNIFVAPITVCAIVLEAQKLHFRLPRPAILAHIWKTWAKRWVVVK